VDYEALVVGGGHAGIEASLALSRLGYSTMLVTQNLDTIGQLSCNPAIGGLAKGNMVREIDALGGEMGRIIDKTMIQFRVLNRSRGPAVQAPRAQADKMAYRIRAKKTLEAEANLHLYQDTVVDFILGSGDGESIAVKGVVTERGGRIGARVVVLTTGTFMNGKMFIGEWEGPGGRISEMAAPELGNRLREMGFDVGRMKTGTPARVHRRSIDVDRMEIQFGDEEVFGFSFGGAEVSRRPMLPCYITYTNRKTHEIIRGHLGSSPLFSGKIAGVGPRYCPSIEDKVVKFPDRERHHVFVEPEGFDSQEIYLNGLSTSLPEDSQREFITSIPGLEHAQIIKPGYAVEYDYLNPLELMANLESKRIQNLFIAGQTNGTSGYEEAAAQGLMGGINAGRRLQGEKPLVLDRSEAYIGVLIDDLVTLGTREPYRMFTSRAEYRIALRHDNADRRLFARRKEAGLFGKGDIERFEAKCSKIEEIRCLLRKRILGEGELEVGTELGEGATRRLEGVPTVGAARKATCREGENFEHLLRDPYVSIEDLIKLDPAIAMGANTDWLRQIELDIKYEGYLRREEQHVRLFRKMEGVPIPNKMDWESVSGLSAESREKLSIIRPTSVGQASRIPGVRSSDIAVILVTLGRK